MVDNNIQIDNVLNARFISELNYSLAWLNK